MKTRSIVAFVGVSLVAIIMVSILSSKNIKELSSGDNDVLGACEITKKDKAKFVCEGEKGKCSETYLGYVLTCSGRKVEQTTERPNQSQDQL